MNINNKLDSLYESIQSFDEFGTGRAANIVRPKTKKELVKIMKETIKKEGWTCDLNFIDTSLITDMSRLFVSGAGYGLSKFRGDISQWKVSNVKDMSDMFNDSKFNGDISRWDVSNVENMNSMFCYSKFNGDISKWDVSNVKDMRGMFANSIFNGDISRWDVSNVEYMSHMFENSSFNKDISKWNVSNVERMYAMFRDSKFNRDISRWDTSNVEDGTLIIDEYGNSSYSIDLR